MNIICDNNTISNVDVLNMLALFKKNGGYDNDSLMTFVSCLLGISEDRVLEEIDRNNLPTSELEQMCDIPENGMPSAREILSILQSYVSNDAEAAELDYVQEALEQAGCDKDEADKLGLGWVWPE